MTKSKSKNDTNKVMGFHPFLFSMFVIAALFANNMNGTEPVSTIRVLIAVLLFTCLVLMVFRFLFHDPPKAALSTTAIVLFTFSYGHLYNQLKEVPFLLPLIRHRYFLSVLACLVAYIIWRLFKVDGKNLAPITRYLNKASLFLILMPVLSIGNYYLASYSKDAPFIEVASSVSNISSQSDIYYIILDAYGREDTLHDIDQIDISPFIASLKERGFYISSESNSNYMQTVLSLASSLNMDYVQNLGYDQSSYEQSSSFRRLFNSQLSENRVRQLLAGSGYQFVAFETGYVTSIHNADIYFQPGPSDKVLGPDILQFNSFETLFLDTTVLQAWFDLQQKSGKYVLEAPYFEHRSRILFTFKTLSEIPKLQGSHFVFAHILVPHPPFVFGENGEIIANSRPFTLTDAQHYPQDEYLLKYSAQLHYTNQLLLSTVDAILKESRTPPIIIVQGDHGPGAHLDWNSPENSNLPERFGILNAYYFPDQNYSRLSPDISPVNSFRVILDQYFGADLPLLPNQHYFSVMNRPFDFIDVSDQVRK